MGRRSLVEAYPQAQAAVPQGGNYFQFPGTVPNLQTSGALTTVLAGLIYVKESGIFRTDCDFRFADDTNAGTVTHRIVTVEFAKTPTPSFPVLTGFSNGFAANAFFGNDVAVNDAGAPTAIPVASRYLNADAAAGAGLLFSGVAITFGNFPQLIVQTSQTQTTLTGLLTSNIFSRAQIIHAGGQSGAKVPFAQGSLVLFALQLTATAAHAITYGDGVFWGVQEEPRA